MRVKYPPDGFVPALNAAAVWTMVGERISKGIRCCLTRISVPARSQVNYCQGMAFVAGIILMYLPEEPAFRMLARLLDERGPNLRRLYQPGLEVRCVLCLEIELCSRAIAACMHLPTAGVRAR